MPTTVEIKDEAYRSIIRKQNEIFDRTGEKRNIKDIVEQALLIGINDIV